MGLPAFFGGGGGAALSTALQGNWVTATPYAKEDIVLNGASTYVCILAHTSGASTEPGSGASWSTYWQVLSQPTPIGTLLAYTTGAFYI